MKFLPPIVYILRDIVVTAAIVAPVMLLISVGATIFKARFAYDLLRVSMAVGGALLAACLVFLWYVTLHFGPLPEMQKWDDAFFMSLVPILIGLLAAIGPKRRWVAHLGRLMIYLVSPGLFIGRVISEQLDPSKEGTATICYAVVTAILWETLCIAAKRRSATQQCDLEPTSELPNS